MVTITRHQPGQAGGVHREDFTQFALLLSDRPAIFVEEFNIAAAVANGTKIALYTVAALNAANEYSGLASNLSADNVAGAKGIVAGEVNVAAGARKVKLYRGGHFNSDALEWHANFDTTAKREAAFRGAPGPVQIVVGRNAYHNTDSVVPT